MVEFLGDHPELPNRLHPGELLVGLVDHALDELQDLGLLGEVPVGGVRNVPSQGPVAHCVQLDPDERRQEPSTVADDHGLLDVQRGLEAVLDLRRRDVLASGGDDDVLDAVDDPDVGSVHPFTHVACHQPAVLGERLGRLLGPVPVTGEDARVLRLDLTGLLVQAEADVRIRLTDGAGPHPTREVPGGHGGVLRHAIQLVDGHPDAGEELEYLRGDGRRTRPGVPAAPEAEALLEGPEHQGVADQVQEAALRGVEAAVGHLLPADHPGQLQAEAKPEALERR